jgi:hypothetical protein
MDENTSSSPSTDSSISEGTTPAEVMNTTGTDSPQPAGDTPAETTTPTPGNPEPTGPGPDTTDPTLPDHGVNPDKGIDPDAGDLPTNPDTPLPNDSASSDIVDLKSMTRAERAAYFQEQKQNTEREVAQAINLAYQPQEVSELRDAYIEAGYDEGTATLLARGDVQDQQNQINAARAEIAELRSGMEVEATELIHTIDWMNPSKEDKFDSKTLEAGSQLYDTLAVTRDERTAQRDANGNPIPGTGQIVEAKLSPKQFWGLVNQIREAGAADARLEGQKAAERQMAAVAPPSSTTTKRETPFDNLSAADMKAQLLAKGVNVT